MPPGRRSWTTASGRLGPRGDEAASQVARAVVERAASGVVAVRERLAGYRCDGGPVLAVARALNLGGARGARQVRDGQLDGGVSRALAARLERRGRRVERAVGHDALGVAALVVCADQIAVVVVGRARRVCVGRRRAAHVCDLDGAAPVRAALDAHLGVGCLVRGVVGPRDEVLLVAQALDLGTAGRCGLLGRVAQRLGVGAATGVSGRVVRADAVAVRVVRAHRAVAVLRLVAAGLGDVLPLAAVGLAVDVDTVVRSAAVVLRVHVMTFRVWDLRTALAFVGVWGVQTGAEGLKVSLHVDLRKVPE